MKHRSAAVKLLTENLVILRFAGIRIGTGTNRSVLLLQIIVKPAGGIAAVPDPYFRYGIVMDVQDGLRTQKTALIQDDLPRGSANRSGCEHSGL